MDTLTSEGEDFFGANILFRSTSNDPTQKIPNKPFKPLTAAITDGAFQNFNSHSLTFRPIHIAHQCLYHMILSTNRLLYQAQGKEG